MQNEIINENVETVEAVVTAEAVMPTFKECGLPDFLVDACANLNYSAPTKIQSLSIPLVLAGKDILAQSQTGSGKTAAFALPIIAKLMEDSQTTALILSPTRELAAQIMDSIHKIIGRKSRIYTALLIGGEPMPRQYRSLQANPRIIVGTPGRVNDHLNRGSLKLKNTKFLVLDETDRMLDLGFGVQLEAIEQYLTSERQTLMFSATLPNNILKLASRYLKNPERVTVGNGNQPALKIKQESINISHSQKYPELLNQLENRDGSIIVFVATKMGTERLADKLCEDGHAADCLHGDLKQSQRTRVTNAFRSKKYRVLIATDVAARGLDIPHIEHVINYDLPHCPEDYVHRIGRTARADSEGSAMCFISPEDKKKWRAIQEFLDPTIKQRGGYERPEGRNPRGGKRFGGGFGGGNGGNGGRSRSEGGFNRDRNHGGNSEPRFNERRSFGGGRPNGEFRPNNGGGEYKPRNSGAFARDDKPRDFRSRDDKPREFRSRDDKPREFRARDDKPREFRARDDKPREFRGPRTDSNQRDFKPREFGATEGRFRTDAGKPRSDRPKRDGASKPYRDPGFKVAKKYPREGNVHTH